MLNIECGFDTYLIASIFDKINLLVWMQSDDGAKGRNRPNPIASVLAGEKDKPKEVIGYASGKDFDEAREEILRQINGN